MWIVTLGAASVPSDRIGQTDHRVRPDGRSRRAAGIEGVVHDSRAARGDTELHDLAGGVAVDGGAAHVGGPRRVPHLDDLAGDGREVDDDLVPLTRHHGELVVQLQRSG